MNVFQRYLAGEFAEEYEEGRLSRREALKLIASVTGSLVLANTILAACAPPLENTPGAASQSAPPKVTDTAVPTTSEIAPTEPQPTASEAPSEAAESAGASPAHGTVSPDDPAIQAGPVEFTSEDGAAVQAYLAQPAGEGTFPVILVCHENRGLTSHIEDVARRFARAGYVALAVDLLSRQGGSAALGSDQVPGALGSAPPDQFVQDFVSGWRYLQDQPFADADRVGMIGFCFGGGVTWRAATQMPELDAAVPFYGPHPSLEAVPQINAAVLAIYGEQDSRINQGIPAIEEAMQQNGKIFEKRIYPDAGHAFFNDTSSRYNPEAARDAWQQALAWFGKYV